jgi:hypothetical protein
MHLTLNLSTQALTPAEPVIWLPGELTRLHISLVDGGGPLPPTAIPSLEAVATRAGLTPWGMPAVRGEAAWHVASTPPAVLFAGGAPASLRLRFGLGGTLSAALPLFAHGQPEPVLLISGAGEAAANGRYRWDGAQWLHADGFHTCAWQPAARHWLLSEPGPGGAWYASLGAREEGPWTASGWTYAPGSTADEPFPTARLLLAPSAPDPAHLDAAAKAAFLHALGLTGEDGKILPAYLPE